jgi:putative ABC transport system permease protein
MFIDYFKIPWKEIRRRRMRSFLTLIGIFIGIAAIISLITLGQGLENAIDRQFQSLGKDKLFIMAKGSTLTAGLSIEAIKITEDDLDIVRQSSGIKRAAGMIYTTGSIRFNDLTRYLFIMGTPLAEEERTLIGEAQNYKIMKGHFLEEGDNYKVVLGYAYTEDSFYGKAIDVGDKVQINGYDFKVVGLMEKIGSPPDDQSVLIPLDTYSDIFSSGEELGLIIAQTSAGEDPNRVAEEVEKDLRKSRNLEEGKEDFSIQTPEQFAESFAVILDIVQIVLIGIAAISLLVGGIGIMNTMYTSVLERTKEIGVMKAIGARNRHIMLMFLIESGLYGLGGGLVGIIIGIGFAKLVGVIFSQLVGPAFLLIEIDWLLVLGALLFSFLVGCLSGIAPARKASKMNPVDSLRYE